MRFRTAALDKSVVQHLSRVLSRSRTPSKHLPPCIQTPQYQHYAQFIWMEKTRLFRVLSLVALQIYSWLILYKASRVMNDQIAAARLNSWWAGSGHGGVGKRPPVFLQAPSWMSRRITRQMPHERRYRVGVLDCGVAGVLHEARNISNMASMGKLSVQADISSKKENNSIIWAF